MGGATSAKNLGRARAVHSEVPGGCRGCGWRAGEKAGSSRLRQNMTKSGRGIQLEAVNNADNGSARTGNEGARGRHVA